MPEGDGIDAGAVLVGYWGEVGLEGEVIAVSLPT